MTSDQGEVEPVGPDIEVFREVKIEALLVMFRQAMSSPDRDAAFQQVAGAIERDWFPFLSVAQGWPRFVSK